MRTLPTINTTRLSLRSMRAGDFERFCELWVEPCAGADRDRALAWDAFLRIAGHWQMTGYGTWAVEIHKTKQMVGHVGFAQCSHASGDAFERLPEASWYIARDMRGRGLGKEAAQAAHDWFDRIVTGGTTCTLHARDADVAKNVARALGYRMLPSVVPSQGQRLYRRGPPALQSAVAHEQVSAGP